MLKLLGIRSLVALIAVLVVAAAIYGMQDRFSAWWAAGQARLAVDRDKGDWRQNELVFLKQAYDRLETQRRALSGNAPASLRNEQQEILRRMEQTANPVRDKVPPEIRALLPDQPRAEPEKPAPVASPAPQVAAQVAPPVAPTPAPEPIELRIGAATFPSIDAELGHLSRDPDLDRLLDKVNKLRARAAKPPEAASKPSAAETSGTAKP